jgi:hypothetical protein
MYVTPITAAALPADEDTKADGRESGNALLWQYRCKGVYGLPSGEQQYGCASERQILQHVRELAKAHIRVGFVPESVQKDRRREDDRE